PGLSERQGILTRLHLLSLFVGEANTTAAAKIFTILISLKAGIVNAVRCEFLVAILGVTGYTDRADHFAVLVADLHTATLGKNLFAARRDQVFHENRLLLCANTHELGGAAERERRIGFAVCHLEPDHGGTVLLLERLHLAAWFDHNHRKRTAVELLAALENGG